MFVRVVKLRRVVNSKCDALLRGYFEYVTNQNGSGSQSRQKTILSLLCLYATVPLVLTLSGPLTDFQRLLLHDIMLFFGLPQNFNWITVLFAMNAIFFQWAMYFRPSTRLIGFLWKIRYGVDHDSVAHFFVNSKILYRGEMKQVIEVVKRRTDRQFFIADYLGYLVFQVCMFYHCCSLYRIIVHHSGFIFTTFTGYLSLLSIVGTSALFDIMIVSFIRSLIIWTITIVMMTIIFLIKFTQLDSLLSEHRLSISASDLHHFMHFHTQTLLVLVEYNRLFGHLLFSLIVFNCPQNTYLLMAVLLGQFGAFPVFILLNYVLAQYVFIVLFHFLAGIYCKRIHKCRTQLYQLNATNEHNSLLSFRVKLGLAFYAEKFNTKRRYGISYGPFGLMSLASFVRFMLL